MVKTKGSSKKKQQRGVDFKKIKRKVGRKLPPPKNTTNTEIKSKAIVLPEQSVASEKAGLAVSRKGLTLKELLQQTSHHNPKVRKDALTGIRDLFLKHPKELRLHKLAVIEKLRERISDDDKLVREALYQLLKAVIFPSCREICSGTQSGKAVHEKHVLTLIPFIPKLVVQVTGCWKSRTLQAFTKIFKSCNMESSVKWACLSAIEAMLVPRQCFMYVDASDQEMLEYQITWIRELPLLLLMLGDKHPLRSRSVLSLLLRLGQCAVSNTLFAQEYDNMQYSLAEFYCTSMDERNVSYGPFVRLDRGAQELSICSLYYVSVVDSLMLKPLVWCCLYDSLEPSVIFQIIEVLHSAYKVGHIQIADLISFFITLLSCFKVFPEKGCPLLDNDEISNRGSFRSVTTVVCSCLLQMGDDFLVLQMLETVVADQILLRPALDNLCALFRVLVALDCRPTRLSHQSIITLSNFLPGYLIDVVTFFPESDDESTVPLLRSTSHYYVLPCYFLFYRSGKLLNLVLNRMGSLVTEKKSSLCSGATSHSSWINPIVSVVLLMHKDVKIRKVLSACKAEIELILNNILVVQSSEEINMAIEERHNIQSAVDRLKAVVGTISER